VPVAGEDLNIPHCDSPLKLNQMRELSVHLALVI